MIHHNQSSQLRIFGGEVQEAKTAQCCRRSKKVKILQKIGHTSPKPYHVEGPKGVVRLWMIGETNSFELAVNWGNAQLRI